MNFKLDANFEEKVYAGVLGKIIGVYLGRPFEQWSHELIMETLGPIKYYVNEDLNKPLVVPDDDITGTFTFLRALSDYDYNQEISARQIGQTWLNNIVEGQTILWWGGVGHSTEHTAFKNLQRGIEAPESGSENINGRIVSEQIGAQIFIDGWAMISPGDPEKAASLAKRAASVSHDGEAVYAAQVIAAMEAQAFIEKDIKNLIDAAKKLIPNKSLIFRVIEDIQEWHAKSPDWFKTRENIARKYGYDKFSGSCHVVPNHALIIMALLHGKGDFQNSMTVINTSGWDTDCNSGNLGCLLGIMNGLATFEGPKDWRSPVGDIMYCPTANGGETITDALRESFKIINIARSMRGMKKRSPKKGARFHFEMLGSTQGWLVKKSGKSLCKTFISNVPSNCGTGSRSFEIKFDKISDKVASEVYVNTFMPESIKNLSGKRRETFFSYNFLCCPLYYPGQLISAAIRADAENAKDISVRLFISYYGQSDKPATVYSELKQIEPDQTIEYSWCPQLDAGNPVFEIGISITSNQTLAGKAYLDFLDISGEAKTCFKRPSHTPPFERGKEFDPPRAEMWRNSWVKATDHWTDRHITGEVFRIGNDDGRGMIITGTSDWRDYSVRSKITCELATSGGLAVRVQGLERFYAAEVSKENKFRLIKLLDGKQILEECDLDFELYREYELEVTVIGNHITCAIDQETKLSFEDNEQPLLCGGIALFVENGTICTNEIYKT